MYACVVGLRRAEVSPTMSAGASWADVSEFTILFSDWANPIDVPELALDHRIRCGSAHILTVPSRVDCFEINAHV